MNLDTAIQQLAVNVPIFNKNVVGAIDFENAVKLTTNMPTPWCAVIPLAESVGPNVDAGGLYQTIEERIGVVVCLASGGRQGYVAAALKDTLLYGPGNNHTGIFNAILNFDVQPGQGNGQKLAYDGWSVLSFDLARTFVQFTFMLPIVITEQDGWIVDGVPLLEIDTNTTYANGMVQMANVSTVAFSIT